MELEPRTSAPVHATGAVSFVALADLSDDASFRLRDEGDVAVLASSIGRVGQLVPVELRPLPTAILREGGPRFQLVAGFRRVGALRMLLRDRVLARVHAALDDEDAWALALANALLTEPFLVSELHALKERFAAVPLTSWALDLLEAAEARAPVDRGQREKFQAWLKEARVTKEDKPEKSEVEMTPQELASELAQRMWETNQDLAVLAEAWADLPREGRRIVLDQARWVARMLSHLEGGR